MHQTAEQELISDAHISDHKKQLIPKAEILHISNHDQNNQTKQKLLTTIKTKIINTYLNKKIINKQNQ